MVTTKEKARRIKYESEQTKHLADKKAGLISTGEFEKRHEQTWVDYLHNKYINQESNEVIHHFIGKAGFDTNYEKLRERFWVKKELDKEAYQQFTYNLLCTTDQILIDRGYANQVLLEKEKLALIKAVYPIEEAFYTNNLGNYGQMCSLETVLYDTYIKELIKAHGLYI